MSDDKTIYSIIKVNYNKSKDFSFLEKTYEDILEAIEEVEKLNDLENNNIENDDEDVNFIYCVYWEQEERFMALTKHDKITGDGEVAIVEKLEHLGLMIITSIKRYKNEERYKDEDDEDIPFWDYKKVAEERKG